MSAVIVTHDQSEALAMADRILLLDRGRIEQDGAPAEIYRRPATLFAAAFLGVNNRLAGEGWELWGELRARRAVGEPAEAIIRLESTRLAGEPGENRLPARLETALYLGDRWDCVFRAGGLRLRLWAEEAPEEGPCWIELPPGALWVF